MSHLKEHACYTAVEASWNVMAHAQKPDFVFRRNGWVHLNRRGASVQSTTGSRGVPISGSNAGYTMFRGSVKSTGYPLHSPVSPSLPFSCVVCHHVSAGVYNQALGSERSGMYITSLCHPKPTHHHIIPLKSLTVYLWGNRPHYDITFYSPKNLHVLISFTVPTVMCIHILTAQSHFHRWLSDA
jgi:hypothetical protein